MKRRLDGSFLRCGVVTCLGALDKGCHLSRCAPRCQTEDQTETWLDGDILHVQSCAKCAKLCKNCAKLCQMCKIVQIVQSCAKCAKRPRIRLRLGWTETSCIQQQGHQSLGPPLPTQVGLGAETSHITLDRVNQQVGAVSEATTADCALKLDESILSPVRSTQHLGWQTDRAEIG